MTVAILDLVHDRPALIVGDLVLEVAPPGDRTTIEVIVERDASLILKAPSGVTAERATQFVTDKRQWIYRKLAEKDGADRPADRQEVRRGRGIRVPRPQLPTHPHRRRPHVRRSPGAWPLPSLRHRGGPRSSGDAPLVHRRRRSVATTPDSPLDRPHG